MSVAYVPNAGVAVRLCGCPNGVVGRIAVDWRYGRFGLLSGRL